MENKTLYGVFNSTMSKVQENLYSVALELYEKTKKEFQKKLPSQKHFKAIKKNELQIVVYEEEQRILDMQDQEIRAKKRILNDQISLLYKEIEALDPRLAESGSSEEKNLYNAWLSSLGFSPSFYSLRQSEYDALLKLEKTKEYRNLKNWDKIKQKYEDLRTLAISNKQKQQIVLDLQNKIDWYWLGIEIPVLFEVQEVKVVDGEIFINNMPVLTTQNMEE